MEKLLLVVEDSFYLTNWGHALAPVIQKDEAYLLRIPNAGASASVRIERPNGDSEITTATLRWEHFNPIGYNLVCYLNEVEKHQVPAGTKVWFIEEPKALPKPDPQTGYPKKVADDSQ